MRPGTSEIPIYYNNSNKNTDCIHYEGKEEIFGYKWQHKRCRR